VNEDRFVTQPRAAYNDVAPSIVHIGTGHFFRGHLAVLAQRLGISIVGVSPHSPELHDTLAAQNFRYTVVTRSGAGNTIEEIDSVKRVLVADGGATDVVRAMTNPNVELVTLTVTQAGYYYDANTGINLGHQEIDRCLHSDEGSSSIGFIVRALSARRDTGIDPFVVMSLDNIVGNGDTLRRAVLGYATASDIGRTGLAEWIADNVIFPNTMVDRIVETTTEEKLAWFAEHFPEAALRDGWPVFTEPMPDFSLVISGHRNHPALTRFADAGAHLVDDVASYSTMKIRMLNGAHVALGMAGRLAGYSYTDEAMHNPVIRDFVAGYLHEIKATVPQPEAVLNQYINEIMVRLCNPAMSDELIRLARNGYEKMPQRVIVPLIETLHRTDVPHTHLMQTLGLWVQYLQASQQIDIADNAAETSGLTTLMGAAYRNMAAFMYYARGDRPRPTTLEIAMRDLQQAAVGAPYDALAELQTALVASRDLVANAVRVQLPGSTTPSRDALSTPTAPSHATDVALERGLQHNPTSGESK
jgi:mannitol-1-phosphate/altronate dehydrogenase